MTPRDLIDQAAADGVAVSLTAAGRLRLAGNDEAVDRWLATVVRYSDAIAAELATIQQSTEGANDA